jgi:hypothetical protein
MEPSSIGCIEATDILAHLERLAAIDGAVSGEVGEIQRAHAEHRSHFRCDQMPDSIVRMDALLAIVQRRAGEIAALEQRVECPKAADEATLQYLGAARNERDAALAELAALKGQQP